MTTFQLDTSGRVEQIPNRHILPGLRWSDLDPFTQGYIEAALRSLWDELDGTRKTLSSGMVVGTNDALANLQRLQGLVRYDRVAPETLARIIEDCARGKQLVADPENASTGRTFWKYRQSGAIARFPTTATLTPLTATLGDDGKVRFES